MAACSTCSVCCEAFTGRLRRCVACPACDYAACTQCIKAFLLSTPSDPACMRCRVLWVRGFLDQHLSLSWRTTELRRHRERVLLDRERALLPATQPAVERAVALRRRAARCAELNTQIRRLRRELRELHREESPQPTPERRSFVAACPSADCRGFLSTQYKCGTCQKHFCSGCREPKVEGHVCDPAVVQSMELIARDSRACPGCGVAISRVSGCDQMYCILCDVAFSYATGQRIEGVIHNPHYFERLERLRTTAGLPAMQGACGGWPAWWTIAPFVPVELQRLYRSAQHVEEVELRQHQRRDRAPANNEDLRVQYCMRELDDAQFMSRLQQREKLCDFRAEVRQCQELFVLLVFEFFVECAREKAAPPLAQDRLLASLETLVNAPLREIGRRYVMTVPQVLRGEYHAEGFKGRADRREAAKRRRAGKGVGVGEADAGAG